MKSKKPKTNFELLIEENYHPEWDGISFEEFIKNRNNKIQPVAVAILDSLIKSGNISTTEKLYSEKLDYLIQTNKTFETKHEEILELWDLLIEIINSKVQIDLKNTFSNDVFHLFLISIQAKIPAADIESKERKLHHEIMTKLIREIDEKKTELAIVIDEIFYWYNKRLFFIREFQLGPLGNESTIIKTIIEENADSLEKLKTNSPYTYINFLALYKILYKNNSEYKAKHRWFYFEQCRNQVLVCKSNNIYFDYYEIIKDFQKINLEKRRWQFNALNYFAGFGEKPIRVVGWFFTLNVFFTILFFTIGVQIKGINSIENVVEKFFTYFYFNNTTMLTVGYGDHYPVSIGAKLSVLLLQILGFACSASAVTLYLRKIFRE